MQVWIVKLCELQLPVQNPAQEGPAQVYHKRIDAFPLITSPKFPSLSSNISKVTEPQTRRVDSMQTSEVTPVTIW